MNWPPLSSQRVQREWVKKSNGGIWDQTKKWCIITLSTFCNLELIMHIHHDVSLWNAVFHSANQKIGKSIYWWVRRIKWTTASLKDETYQRYPEIIMSTKILYRQFNISIIDHRSYSHYIVFKLLSKESMCLLKRITTTKCRTVKHQI